MEMTAIMSDRRILKVLATFAIGVCFCILSPGPAHAQWTAMNPVKKVQQESDGAVFTMSTGTLKLQVCSDSVIRVLYSPTASFPKRPDYVVIKESWPESKFTMQSTDDAVVLSTSLLKITVTRKDGAIAYANANGVSLVQEASRSMTPEKVNGEDTYRAESFISIYGSHEALYGLGQHQAGVWNYRGESVDISQDNSNISVPLLVSSKGYGIFWNNASRSRFNNRFANYLYISSEVADVIDYYFLYGPDFDKIIAGYRELTGQRQCSASGPTVSGSARTATNLRTKFWRRQEVSRSAHSRRQHRAGLVLVEPERRIHLQQELSRSQRHDGPAPRRATSI